MDKTIQILLMTSVLCLGSNREATAQSNWLELDTEQRRLLMSLAEQWESIEDSRRVIILQGLSKWLTLSDQDKEAAIERFEQWNRLEGSDRSRQLNQRRNLGAQVAESTAQYAVQ